MRGECVRCPQCGRRNVAGSAFCRFCGQRLAPQHRAPSPPAPPRGTAPAPAGSSKKARRKVRWGRVALLAVGAVAAAGIAGATVTVVRAVSGLPSVESLVSAGNLNQNSVVYDINGQEVAVLKGTVNRQPVPLSQVAPVMQHAIVAIEDHSFYTNPGFDLRSIIRAAVVDLIHRRAQQGASTITEQLAKDLYLTDKKTLTYKVREFIIGIELARLYSKQQILQMYLNEVYFGNGANGIYAAAESYFGIPPARLDLAQASLLAGLPQAPSLYDPLVNLKLAKARQRQVLDAMVKYGYISQAQANAAYAEPLHFAPAKSSNAASPSGAPFPYPWFIEAMIERLHSQDHLSYNEI